VSRGAAARDRNPSAAASQRAWSVLGVSEASPWLWSTGGAVLAICSAVGNPHPFPVRAAAGGMRRAWSGGGTDTVEWRQASGHAGDDGVLGALGAAAELAGNGPGVPDQLGSGVPLGGMVCPVGLGAAATAAGVVDRHWRNPLGTREAGGPVSHRDLSDRQSLPTTVMGRAATDAGHTAARLAGLGVRGGEGVAVCV